MTNSKSASRWVLREWLPVIMIVVLAFSYPITTVFLLSSGMNTADANVLIKGSVAALFLIALAMNVPYIQWPAYYWALPALLSVYGLRILYDVFILDIVPIFLSKGYVIAYFFGLTFLPVMAVFVGLKPNHVKRLHRALYIMLVGANLALLFYILVNGAVTSESVFRGRYEVEGDYENSAIINPIMIGLMGALLASVSVGRLAVMQSLKGRDQIITAGFVALGMMNLLIGDSRGPAIAFALALLVIFYTMVKGTVGLGVIRARPTMWVYGGGLIVGIVYLVLSQALSIQLFERFSMMVENRRYGVLEERDYALADAMADFVSSPFYGSSYLTTARGQSPHNIIIDVFMATGVIGGILMIVAMFWALRGLWRLLNGVAGAEGYCVGLCALGLLVVGMTSGSVSQYPECWLFIAAVTVCGNIPFREESGRRVVVRAKQPGRRYGV